MHFASTACIFLLGLLLLMATALGARVRNLDPDLIYYENERDENGYSFSYKTKDGQYREERGEIDPETGFIVVTGVYRYVGTDGKTYEFNYVADQEGYRIEPKQPEVGYAPPLSQAALLSLVG